MFQKFASLEVLEVKGTATRQSSASLQKFASWDDYRTDDGYIYVRVRAISSRVNKNHDGWPSSELKKAYRTFIGKPIFVDHHNTDPKRGRGVILDADLHIEDSHTSSLDSYYANAPAAHLPPTWIELLLEVDAKRFPKLAKAIINEDIDGVSMGANVEMSKCSHCGNEATAPEQFCKHIVSKGAYFDFKEKDGTKTSKKSYEDCYGVGFFEISFVFDPADETALRIGDPIYAKKQAHIAAIQKEGDFGATYGNCPSCGEMTHPAARQCASCGAPTDSAQPALNEYQGDVNRSPIMANHTAAFGVPTSCPACGEQMDAHDYQCNHCGTPNEAAAPHRQNLPPLEAPYSQPQSIYSSTIPMAEGLEYYSPDEVGETIEGISRPTYQRLWDFVGEQEQNGTGAPMGGDVHDPYGENGPATVEDPASRRDMLSLGRGNMASIWDRLTPQEQTEINECFERAHQAYDGAYDDAQRAADPQSYQQTKTANQYIEKRGDKWVITQKGTGKVLSTHDSEEKANASFSAMEANKHGKTAERHDEPQADMTTAPEKVDTLRQEQVCPICGSNMEDGVCEVCNYEEPPEGFDNPDLEKAKEVDEQLKQEQAQQAQPQPAGGPQGMPPPGGPTPGGPGAGPQLPLQGGAMPAPVSKIRSLVARIQAATKTAATSVVSSDKTSSNQNGGRINTQERPILPATRQLSDKPLAQKTVSEAKKPVESKSNKETMTDTIKTADGATAQGEGVQAEKRVDVEGIGAVTGDPLSGIDHENVENDTGDFVAPHTDTWSGNEGDSLGQQDGVTSETGDLFTVAGTEKTADSSDDLGGPIGEGVGNGGNASQGGSTWDTPGNGFPDHDPTRVDLNAGLKEEVGPPTSTDSSEEFRSLKHTEPVTSEDANSLGGPIGVAVASAKARLFKAMQVAEAEVAAGIREASTKFERVSALEDKSEEVLDSMLETLSSVKTAGLKKTPPTQQKVAGRVPSFKPVTASFDIEAHGVADEFEDSIF